MKNGIIMILSMLLCAGAFLTRPTEDDFNDLVHRRAARDPRGMPERLLTKSPTKSPAKSPRPDRSPDRSPDRTLASAELLDRYLWVEVRRDGKTLYAGLFNHWWDSRGRIERV